MPVVTCGVTDGLSIVGYPFVEEGDENIIYDLYTENFDGEYAWGLRVEPITYGIKNGDKELYKALEDKTEGAVRGGISNTCHLSRSLFLSA